jgi:hypothetical protein
MVITTVLVTALAIVCSYTIYLAIYRVYIHPLSKYPGPKLAALTYYHHYYYAFKGQRVAKITEWHIKYGEIVRISPNELSFIGETAWKDIYGHKQVYLLSRTFRYLIDEYSGANATC